MSEHEKNAVPEWAWPAVVIVFLGVALATAYFTLGGRHEHISDGYVGPDTCRKCHKEQYESWAETRMAHSLEVLAPGAAAEAKKVAGLDPDEDYREEPECLRCHTTGYGRVGGFTTLAETPQMAGVTCEACHGPGGMYAGNVMNTDNPSFATADAISAGLVYPPTEEVCRHCHNEGSPFIGMEYKFDYEARVKRGTHKHYQLKYEHAAKP